MTAERAVRKGLRPRFWVWLVLGLCGTGAAPEGVTVTDAGDTVRLVTPTLEASFRRRNYVTGVGAGTFVDRKTGFHDAGFGLDVIDWIMEPGSDAAYRGGLKNDLPYNLEERFHGKGLKRCLEGPQMCHAAELDPQVIRGKDFVAVRTVKQYTTAAPGQKAGSTWTQTLVFPEGQRYFVSSDRMDCVNAGDATFFRMDMPGHIKHDRGDTFSEVYLSYEGIIPASDFFSDFPPDRKHQYRRDAGAVPKRFIRAYHLRDPKTGKAGPWLAGMTLNPADVYEAWCHQRGYVCMIEEIGGRPVQAGGAIEAAFVVGYFDSVEEMEAVYDRHAGHSGLEVGAAGWRLR